MCYSAEVSFITWTFGMACAAFLASIGQPFMSFAFPLLVSQMQLVEGLRWIHALPDPLLALLGKAVLYAQPAVALLEAGQTKWISVYIVSQAVMEFLGGSRDNRFVVAKDGHLAWKWLSPLESIVNIPYWVALFFAASILYPRWLNTILMVLLIYYVAMHYEYGTWGSLWCMSVNILWFYYLLR
jgi:hypothetical protein